MGAFSNILRQVPARAELALQRTERFLHSPKNYLGSRQVGRIKAGAEFLITHEPVTLRHMNPKDLRRMKNSNIPFRDKDIQFPPFVVPRGQRGWRYKHPDDLPRKNFQDGLGRVWDKELGAYKIPSGGPVYNAARELEARIPAEYHQAMVDYLTGKTNRMPSGYMQWYKDFGRHVVINTGEYARVPGMRTREEIQRMRDWIPQGVVRENKLQDQIQAYEALGLKAPQQTVNSYWKTRRARIGQTVALPKYEERYINTRGIGRGKRTPYVSPTNIKRNRMSEAQRKYYEKYSRTRYSNRPRPLNRMTIRDAAKEFPRRPFRDLMEPLGVLGGAGGVAATPFIPGLKRREQETTNKLMKRSYRLLHPPTYDYNYIDQPDYGYYDDTPTYNPVHRGNKILRNLAIGGVAAGGGYLGYKAFKNPKYGGKLVEWMKRPRGKNVASSVASSIPTQTIERAKKIVEKPKPVSRPKLQGGVKGKRGASPVSVASSNLPTPPSPTSKNMSRIERLEYIKKWRKNHQPEFAPGKRDVVDVGEELGSIGPELTDLL